MKEETIYEPFFTKKISSFDLIEVAKSRASLEDFLTNNNEPIRALGLDAGYNFFNFHVDPFIGAVATQPDSKTQQFNHISLYYIIAATSFHCRHFVDTSIKKKRNFYGRIVDRTKVTMHRVSEARMSGSSNELIFVPGNRFVYPINSEVYQRIRSSSAELNSKLPP